MINSPVQPWRRGALAITLAAASLLATTLAPAPALAATDEHNDCANLEWQWEQAACEAGDGMGGGGSTGAGSTPSDSSDAAEKAGHDNRPELGPKWFVAPVFDHTFGEPVGAFRRIFKDSPLDRLATAYAYCNWAWTHASRATHRHPHRILTLHKDDPNDEWNQEDFSEVWEAYHCDQVFDLVGLP